MKGHSDLKFKNMTTEQLTEQLKFLGELNESNDSSPEVLKDRLKKHERSRHLILWSDHSCILNHGHLLTVNFLYDPAFYYTREELLFRSGVDIDVEAVVQTPQAYILARCTDKLTDQLCYTDNRFQDVEELGQKIRSEYGVPINDYTRAFQRSSANVC